MCNVRKIHLLWCKLFICWIVSESWGISVSRISQEGFCMQIHININNNYSNKNNYQQSSAHFQRVTLLSQVKSSWIVTSTSVHVAGSFSVVLTGIEVSFLEIHCSDGDFTGCSRGQQLPREMTHAVCLWCYTWEQHVYQTTSSEFSSELSGKEITLKYLHFPPKYVSVNKATRTVYETISDNKNV